MGFEIRSLSSEFEDVISDSPPTCVRHYDALLTKIDM